MMDPVTPNLQRLQADIRRLERGGATDGETLPPLATGAAEVDAHLPGGGLSRHGVHELLAPPGVVATGTAGAAAGFAAALAARAAAETSGPVLWCRPRKVRDGDLYAPGLVSHGLDPSRVLMVRARDNTEALWAMEEALRSGALAAAVAEVEALTHTAYRRLQLAAERGGVPGFLMRAGDPVRAAGPVMTRWAVVAAPSRPDVATAPWLGRPRFDVHLLRARRGAPGRWLMEWRYDGALFAPGRFAVVAGAGDNAAVAPADATVRNVA